MTPEKTRPTRKIEIYGNKFVLRTDLTGRELRDIEYAMYESVGVKKTSNPNKPEMSFSTKDSLIRKEEAKLRAVIVSVNGDNDVVNAILDLPGKVYLEVIKIVETETDPKVEPDSDKVS